MIGLTMMVKMNVKNLLLDTNIYGLLISDKDLHKIHQIIENSDNVHIYGFDIIRRELKAAPSIRVAGLNIRAALLRSYASLITKEYSTSQLMCELAESYDTIYRELGGRIPKKNLQNDFLIVACASVKCVPLVVSEDNATMLNEIARKAYSIANKSARLSNPSFISYKEFKCLIL
jgi:hypothetical protein